jgi:carbon storage regulator
MLVLSRKVGEEVIIDGAIRVCIVRVRGNRVRLGIQAPENVCIRRQNAGSSDRAPAPKEEPPLCSTIGLRRRA